MAARRNERLAAQITRDLSVLVQGQLADPGIGMVSVRYVQLTADARVATVFVTAVGDAPAVQESLAALERARGFLRRHLANDLGTRTVPELRFQLDPDMVTSEAIALGLKSSVDDADVDTSDQPPP